MKLFKNIRFIYYWTKGEKALMMRSEIKQKAQRKKYVGSFISCAAK